MKLPPRELLEITEKSISWQSMKLLLSAADKRQARPSHTISLIKWQRQWHLNADPALEGKKSTNSSEKSKTVLLSVIQSAIGGKKAKVHCLKKKNKKQRRHHTPLHVYTHTHFLCTVCNMNSQEKAGPADSAVIKHYFRISLFVLGGSVWVKCSS